MIRIEFDTVSGQSCRKNKEISTRSKDKVEESTYGKTFMDECKKLKESLGASTPYTINVIKEFVERIEREFERSKESAQKEADFYNQQKKENKRYYAGQKDFILYMFICPEYKALKALVHNADNLNYISHKEKKDKQAYKEYQQAKNAAFSKIVEDIALNPKSAVYVSQVDDFNPLNSTQLKDEQNKPTLKEFILLQIIDPNLKPYDLMVLTSEYLEKYK